MVRLTVCSFVCSSVLLWKCGLFVEMWAHCRWPTMQGSSPILSQLHVEAISTMSLSPRSAACVDACVCAIAMEPEVLPFPSTVVVVVKSYRWGGFRDAGVSGA